MPLFDVRATASFERRLRKYASRHRDVTAVYEELLRVLAADPYNRSRSHPIRPLPVFQRYRYRKQRWRFVYSISDEVVTLDYCDLRRERTYRRQR
jgi:mRNA-degrading endonuclease YafQ of YafQ-DinJ toxin-antitoxin module